MLVEVAVEQQAALVRAVQVVEVQAVMETITAATEMRTPVAAGAVQEGTTILLDRAEQAVPV